MSKDLTPISPEGLDVANCYLQYGDIDTVSNVMQLPKIKVTQLLNKREVKQYIDTVYLDRGYRNRDRIGDLLDTIIASKLEEAEESGIYTSKDLMDVLSFAHKMRMDEIKAQGEADKHTNIKSQTNVQINEGLPYGSGNYAKLLEKLMNGDSTQCGDIGSYTIGSICFNSKVSNVRENALGENTWTQGRPVVQN